MFYLPGVLDWRMALKIIPHKHHKGLYILHSDDDKYLGAGIGGGIDDTRITWYSGVADIPDTEACDIIRKWVKEIGGKAMGSGMCTRDQSWNEWRIPVELKSLLKKYLVSD